MSTMQTLSLGTQLRRLRADALPSKAPSSSVDVRFARLYFGLAAAVKDCNSGYVQFTGAARGVGTSFVVNSVVDVANRTGGSLYVEDLSRTDLARGDLLAAMARGAPMHSKVPPLVERGHKVTSPNLILLDTAPIATSALSLSLAEKAAGTVLVVEAERTTRVEIDQALLHIQACGGKCLGFVLNRRRLFP